jgi:hypothetical protein
MNRESPRYKKVDKHGTNRFGSEIDLSNTRKAGEKISSLANQLGQ